MILRSSRVLPNPYPESPPLISPPPVPKNLPKVPRVSKPPESPCPPGWGYCVVCNILHDQGSIGKFCEKCRINRYMQGKRHFNMDGEEPDWPMCSRNCGAQVDSKLGGNLCWDCHDCPN